MNLQLHSQATPVPPWKRAGDIFCCLLVLPFLALLTLFMTGLVSRVSPGPVLFRQERVGYRGRRFMCFKFRTMVVGAPTAVHQQHFANLVGTKAKLEKIENGGDSRLIPGGRFLRASGLDELPQIINVLRGDMSLIGPRPCIPYEYELYQPWQRERFDTLPGLTGLWQVSGKNHTTFEEMVHLDIKYARTKTWWLDLKIILLTPLTILSQLAECRRARKKSPPATVPFAVAPSESIARRQSAPVR